MQAPAYLCHKVHMRLGSMRHLAPAISALPLLSALAPALGLVIALTASVPASADPLSELGLQVLPWSKKVAERRYESPRDFDGTVKFFRDKFKGSKHIQWGREVSLPTVKYVHLANVDDTARWEGINIYVLPDGRVRYYILERTPRAGAGPSLKP